MVDEGRIGEREEAFSGDRLFPADLQWGTEVVDTWNEAEREEVLWGRGGCWFVRGGRSSGHRWPLIDQRVDIIEGVNGQSMNGRDFDTVFRAINI